jgi:ribonuclease HII
VSAGAVWLDGSFFENRTRCKIARAANDSKKLSPAAREELHAVLCEWGKQGVARFAQATADVLEIDAYNILGATRLAMSRCLQLLAKEHALPDGRSPFLAVTSGADTPLFVDDASAWPGVLVDGLPLKPFAWRHTALVGGDGRSLCIALASILAKVRRDHLMAELDQRFPQYGFAVHKGYATTAHIAAIREHGPCTEHRPLFLRAILTKSPAVDAQVEFAFAN